MKTIREIALTSYYPYGRNKEKIIAKRIFDIDEAINKHNEQIRAEAKAKTIEEFARRLKLKFVELPLDDLIVLDILKDINRVAEQMRE